MSISTLCFVYDYKRKRKRKGGVAKDIGEFTFLNAMIVSIYKKGSVEFTNWIINSNLTVCP